MESSRRRQPFQGCGLLSEGLRPSRLCSRGTALAGAHVVSAADTGELRTWWPGTESNRRRQPFQGCGLLSEGLRPSCLCSRGTALAGCSPLSAADSGELRTWWPGTESNRRRQPFQGCALPTELPGQTRLINTLELRWDRCRLNASRPFDYSNDVKFPQSHCGGQTSRMFRCRPISRLGPFSGTNVKLPALDARCCGNSGRPRSFPRG